MNRKFSFGGAVAGFFCSGLLCAGLGLAQEVRLVPEERTEENFPTNRQGYQSDTATSMKMDPLEMKMTAQGEMLMEGNMNMKMNEQTQVEVLEKGKFRLVNKTWGTTKTNFGGQEVDEPVEQPLSELPIILELTERGYEARLESGDEPNAEQREALSELEETYQSMQQMNNWEAIVATYGEELRSVGETWELDEEALNRLMPRNLGEGIEAEIELGEGTITLEGVEEIDGVKHALLSMDSTMTMGGTQADTGMKMTMKAKMKTNIKRNLEEFYDAELNLELVGDIEMSVDEQEAGFGMQMKGPMKMTWQQKDSLAPKEER